MQILLVCFCYVILCGTSIYQVAHLLFQEFNKHTFYIRTSFFNELFYSILFFARCLAFPCGTRQTLNGINNSKQDSSLHNIMSNIQKKIRLVPNLQDEKMNTRKNKQRSKS